MGRQYFQDLAAEPNVADFTAITATTETNLLSSSANISLYQPIPPGFSNASGAPQVGRIWRFYWGGIWSTNTTGTLTLTPRYGLTTGGVSLGASVAQTVPISLTNAPWEMELILVCRALSATASSSTFVGTGSFRAAGTAGTAGTGSVVSFGGTTISTADTTISNGICMGWTLSVAGSVTPKIAFCQQLN